MELKYQTFLKALATDGFHKDFKHFKLKAIEEEFLNAKVFAFDDMKESIIIEDSEWSSPPDLPFKSCFFEVLGDEKGWVITGPNGDLRLVGVFVAERSPTQTIINLLVKVNDKYEVHFFTDSGVLRHLKGLVDSLLQQLYSKQSITGTASNRNSIKLKTTEQKLRHRVSSFIVVSNKKYHSQPFQGITVDWSHRWRVRGHWRAIPNKIGKDRDGNPQANFTWINDYIKGPEEKDLIEKTRIIKNDI